MKHAATLAVLLLLPLPATAAQTAAAVPRQQFISLSDIHFNPYYDPSLMAALEAADVSGWAGVFASSKVTAPSAYGADTNWPLFRMLLADLKTRCAGAAFVTISGDFLAHDFPQNFQLYSPDKSGKAYQSFVTKTVQFIAAQLQAALPSARMFPSLGNNDSDCGDYEITPNGWFLGVFANAWAPSVREPTFVSQFSPAGYYAVPAPMPNTTLIGLNSIFFSVNYDNACGEGTTDYGAQELKWLDQQLSSAAKEHRRVWLLYHIPPGVNVWSTLSGAVCPSPVLMWKTQYNNTFNALMQKYASTIPVSLAGHTHMDDFRLMGNAYIHMTPAVSPMFTNNPAYETVRDSPLDATIVDYTVVSFPLNNPQPAWGPEYTFSTAYHQPSYTPATIMAMRNAIDTDAATRALYMQYYTVSNPNSTTITPKNWFGYWCGTGAQTGAAFTSCYCAIPPAH
jgi:hypothetical protein